MAFILYIICLYWLPFIGMSKLFEKAGQPSWAAFVPFYNAYTVVKIVGAPQSWLVWMLVPIVNFFIIINMLLEMNKSFGRHSFSDSALAVIVPYAFYFYLGTTKPEYLHASWAIQNDWKKRYREVEKQYRDSEKDKHQTEIYKSALRKLEKENEPFKKSTAREWTESIIFAVFAAHFIRMFLIEAYTIPTPSMEGSLLVGDFLFVSKVHYGSRLPMTPIAFPLIHNMMPFSGSESYSTALQWGYSRAPKIQNVERYDPVVFNYPEDDTSYGGLDENGMMVDYTIQYHNILKMIPPSHREAKRQQLLINGADKLVYRPVDKRTHYIKRCVGIPGDKIEVRAGVLYVNDKEAEVIKGVQYKYRIIFKESMDPYELESKYAITFKKGVDRYGSEIIDRTEAFLNPTVATEILKKEPTVTSIERIINEKNIYDGSFPYNLALFPWNIDYYGPITIPKKGTAIQLSLQNIDLYTRLIAAYEGNKLEIKNGKIFINGQESTSYTPKMDYYWMMGDNRNNSADSRSWGFVPEDHIVGKPLFIWLSLKNGSLRNGGVRWERLFMGASGK